MAKKTSDSESILRLEIEICNMREKERVSNRTEAQKKHKEDCKKFGYTWKNRNISAGETFKCPVCGQKNKCEYNYNSVTFTLNCDCVVTHSADGWYQWKQPNK